jgi:hypothetical protein
MKTKRASERASSLGEPVLPSPSRSRRGATGDGAGERGESAPAFPAEQEAPKERVHLQPAQNLPGGYVEAVLLDADGEPTPAKRILFP